MSQPARTTAPRSPRTTSAHTTAARTAARTTAARPSTARAGNRGATGPQLRLVPPGATTPARPTRARRSAHRRAPFVVLIVGMLAITTLGLLLLNTAIAVNSLHASQQRAANGEQAEQVARLEQQVVAADTAAELARAARAAGLVPPGAAAHLVLQPDGTSVLLGTATPAPAPGAPTTTTTSPTPAPTTPTPAPTTPTPAPGVTPPPAAAPPAPLTTTTTTQGD